MNNLWTGLAAIRDGFVPLEIVCRVSVSYGKFIELLLHQIVQKSFPESVVQETPKQRQLNEVLELHQVNQLVIAISSITMSREHKCLNKAQLNFQCEQPA